MSALSIEFERRAAVQQSPAVESNKYPVVSARPLSRPSNDSHIAYGEVSEGWSELVLFVARGDGAGITLRAAQSVRMAMCIRYVVRELCLKVGILDFALHKR